MKNILCVGWCDVDNVINYGQILQACAMMEILRNCSDGNIKYVSFLPKGKRELIKYYTNHINICNGHFIATIRTNRTIIQFVKRNRVVFEKNFSGKIKQNEIEDFDVFVCGSDQIWHPQNYNKVYFLEFGGCKHRISYAASLPKSCIEPQFEGVYKKISENLRKFNHISVREEGSVEFIQELSGKDVCSVLDPTYLISKDIWLSHTEVISLPNEYIFVYVPNEMNEELVRIVDQVKKNTKINNVVVILTRGENLFKGTLNLRFVSLGQFLYIIDKASVVVTTSFHAVVFSSIFHTEFWAYDVPNRARGEDIRLKDLLHLLELEERLIASSGNVKALKTIDYNEVEDIISARRKVSTDFLKHAMGE